MKVTRRTFLKVAGAAGAASVAGRPAKAGAARARPSLANEAMAVLVDITRCVGCRACEAACSEANGLPGPAMAGDESVFRRKRATDPRTYTVVNRSVGPTEGAPAFVKTQCMHCVQPACVSACLTRAMEKLPKGPVVYHEDRCMGCRYCMVACPFGVPKFEYEKPVPAIRKCNFCFARLARRELPACVKACPSGALEFGPRGALLEVARARIYQNPDRYVHHIYGEHEVGGTGWLYISHVPFEQLGLRTDLGTTPYPHYTWPFLSAVPFVLMLWPPLLVGLYAFTHGRGWAAQGESGQEHEKEHRRE
jgi:Fe-S-cluster-containing dehydrogenase component